MSYCTLDDLKAALPERTLIQLTDDAGAGEVDQTKVDDAVQYAGSMIDGYLGGRYTLPLDPVPALIRAVAVDLSIFHIYSRNSDAEMPRTVSDKYPNATKLLGLIQRGEVQIGVTPISGSGDGGGSGSYRTNKRSSDRVFGPDVLKRF